MKIGVATLLEKHKPKFLKIFEQHCRLMITGQRIPGMVPLRSGKHWMD